MMKFFGPLVAAVILLGASPANATIFLVPFTVSGTWVPGGTGSPYGLGPSPTITGSFTIDDSLVGAAQITAIDYVTGTRTWTLADIDPNGVSISILGGGFVEAVSVNFLDGQNKLVGTGGAGSASVFEGQNYLICNGCYTLDRAPSPIPEPTTWALLITGFGLVGGALRRRPYAATA